MRYAVLLAAVAILVISTGCKGKESVETAEAKTPPTFTPGQILPTEAVYGRSGIGVVLKDMDGDGDLDIVSAAPAGVKYFENVGNGNFTDHGKIADTEAEYGRSGIGVAIDDIDGDGVLDIVIAAPSGIRIIKNPIAQKK